MASFTARAGNTDLAERLSAEAWEAGAVGIEELDAGGVVELRIHAPIATVSAVRDAVATLVGEEAVSAPEPAPDVDWSERWKTGLTAIEVSPRLIVRPSFVEHPLKPGQSELLIDPGQAFGTGGHASTRLALEWIDATREDLPARPRILDVGTGTGVLALAAIRLAGGTGFALDVDPAAAPVARANAVRNGLEDRLHPFTGSLDAVGGTGFDLVAANLLTSELVPLIAALADVTRAGGFAVFSGLLAGEADEVSRLLAGAGFVVAGSRSQTDASGECWTALLMRR